MNNKNELQSIHDLEEEYKSIFEEFANSDEEQTYSKKEVKKIIEAFLFKEIVENPNHRERKSRVKNLFISARNMGEKLFSFQALMRFGLSYLFNTGILLLINEYMYSHLFSYKSTVFILALGFTVIERLLKPLLFLADLISFTFLKVGLATIAIFTLAGFGLTYLLDERIPFERLLIISIIVSILMSVLELIKKDSGFKTDFVDGEVDEDDQ
ncbi:MAG: hypothetical protein GX490_06045 [Bacilli bacterium]|nr:hypothetical protein [Bacilli bacterium]